MIKKAAMSGFFSAAGMEPPFPPLSWVILGVGTVLRWGRYAANVAQPAHRVKDKRLRRAFGILDTARWLGFVMVKGLLPTPVEQG